MGTPWFSTRGQILQVVAAICSAICALVLLGAHFALTHVPDWLYDVAWVALGILIGVLAGLAGRKFRSAEVADLGSKSKHALALLEQAGLAGAFDSRLAASQAIVAAVANAKWVWVLSNMGTDWVGDGGILTRPLKERWARGEHVRLRVLLLNPRSALNRAGFAGGSNS